jgi:hypothetical protein
MKAFTVSFLVLWAFLLLSALWVYETVLAVEALSPILSVMLYFLVTGLSVHYILLKYHQEKPNRFITAYMGVVSAKLFVSLLAALVFGLIFRDIAAVVVVHFLVCYLAFTFLETVFMYRISKPERKV